MKTNAIIISIFLLLSLVDSYADTPSPMPETPSLQNAGTNPLEFQEMDRPAEDQQADRIKERAEKEVNSNIEVQKDITGKEIPEEGEEAVAQIADPLYPWNNAMYHFNDRLYYWILKPVAKGYSSVFPEDIRMAVSNFFSNLTTPVRFAGNLLQLKIKKAGNEFVRFVYNSTAGVFGLVDAAKTDFNISRHDEDLGQTLGTYGIAHGFYIVWPFIGPSSLRDTVGIVGDGFLSPVYYLSPWEASLEIAVYDRVNDTSLHIGTYEDLKESAIDPYVAIRDAYIQHRKKEVEE